MVYTGTVVYRTVQYRTGMEYDFFIFLMIQRPGHFL